MADKATSAGDSDLFGKEKIQALRTAVGELSWLLSRGYAESSALGLVGNRHGLNARQRKAVQRSACADTSLLHRRQRYVEPAALGGSSVDVDGFNCLILCESLLTGAPVFRGRDGALRDLASVHGAWKQGAATGEALRALSAALSQAACVCWWLDRPVSMSGRLAALIEEHARLAGSPWEVRVVDNPDSVLARSHNVVATADGWIQDQCTAWTDLPSAVAATAQSCWVVELGQDS